MATVTQLSSGSISTGTSINLTGVSVEPGDMLVLFVATYSTFGVTGISNLGNVLLSNNLGLVNTASFPDIRSDNYYSLQTATVTSQTITVDLSSSAAGAAILFRVRPDFGNQLVFRQRSTQASNTLSSSFATPAINVQEGSIVVGGCVVADDTTFTDTGTSGGSWSSVFSALNSVGTYDLAAFGQTKIMNAAVSSLSYNGTFPASEYAVGYIIEIIECGLPYVGMVNL